MISGNLFDSMTFFQDFSPDQRDQLRPLFRLCLEPAGTVIFEQGDPAECLFLIVDGEVNIRYKPEDGPVINVAHVRPEGVVGWSAALGSPAYTSAAVCATDCQMLRVRGQDLRHLCKQHPETGALLLDRLAAVIAERLRNTHHHVIALLEQGLHVRIRRTVTAG